MNLFSLKSSKDVVEEGMRFRTWNLTLSKTTDLSIIQTCSIKYRFEMNFQRPFRIWKRWVVMTSLNYCLLYIKAHLLKIQIISIIWIFKSENLLHMSGMKWLWPEIRNPCTQGWNIDMVFFVLLTPSPKSLWCNILFKKLYWLIASTKPKSHLFG